MGYVLLVYRGLGLGCVKNLGNRTNNLLPMARRIRMEIR
jgi:NOL1/NOP2/fmu family ribosome biogenesis protein